MMNPGNIMKLMQAKNEFTSKHPKFAAFLEHMLRSGIPEGSVIEITVTKPGEAPVTANMKVQASDLELLEGLKKLK